MEFPPKSWDVFPAEQFDTASPSDPGELRMELLVQMRDNGCIQDYFRIALGGMKLLKALLSMRDIFVVPEDFPDWVIEYGKWPADLIFSRNQTTTVWVDVNAMIEACDIIIRDMDGTKIKDEDVLEALTKTTHIISRPGCSARWVMGIDGADKMVLTVQVLPASAAFLNSRPVTKGYEIIKICSIL
jgi:hypothetical protein